MTHDYVAQKDQFLLTILPFNKRSFRSNHFELCNLMHVGRKQHILFTTLGRYRYRYRSFNAIMVFKTKVTRSQRNGKDNANMNYCHDGLLAEDLRQDQS